MNKTNGAAVVDDNAKWRAAAEQARKTARWAKTMTQVLIARNRGSEPKWEVVNFVGPNRAESRGIVDLLAIRRVHRDVPPPHRPGDLFDIVLIQVKGGSAQRPSKEDRERLRQVRKHYGAKAVVLAEWKRGTMPSLQRLTGDDWVPTNPAEVFYSSTKATIPSRGEQKPSEAASVARSLAAKRAWAKRRTA